MPFVFGIVVAYFLDPVADRLETFGLSRTSATVTVLGSFALIMVGIIVLLGPVFIDQISTLIGKIPEYTAMLEKQYGEVVKNVLKQYAPSVQNDATSIASKFSAEILVMIGAVLQSIVSSGKTVFNFISLMFVSPVVAFYMLRDWDILVKKIDNLLPRAKLSVFRKNFQKIDRIISAYIRGQVSVCMVMAIFYSVFLTFVGLNYGFAVGLITGFLSFVPYVGFALGAVTGLLIAYVQYGFTDGMFLTLMVFLLGSLTEGNFIMPKLVGKSVELHPAWIIFALLASGVVFGFTGILIAIPLAAVIGVLTRSSVDTYKHSELYLGVDPSLILGETAVNEPVFTVKETPIFESFREFDAKHAKQKNKDAEPEKEPGAKEAVKETKIEVKPSQSREPIKEPEVKKPSGPPIYNPSGNGSSDYVKDPATASVRDKVREAIKESLKDNSKEKTKEKNAFERRVIVNNKEAAEGKHGKKKKEKVAKEKLPQFKFNRPEGEF